jgi:hypothetical protein
MIHFWIIHRRGQKIVQHCSENQHLVSQADSWLQHCNYTHIYEYGRVQELVSSDMINRCQDSGSTCGLHCQDIRWRQQVPLKCLSFYQTTWHHVTLKSTEICCVATSQKTWTYMASYSIVTALGTSHLTRLACTCYNEDNPSLHTFSRCDDYVGVNIILIWNHAKANIIQMVGPAKQITMSANPYTVSKFWETLVDPTLLHWIFPHVSSVLSLRIKLFQQSSEFLGFHINVVRNLVLLDATLHPFVSSGGTYIEGMYDLNL